MKASSTIARQHIHKVFADLNSLLEATANEPDKTSVHHLRTNTRRVEALILHRLPKGSEGRLLKVLKKVRRRAGTVRDLDVQIDLVEGHTSDASFDDRAVVRTYLETLRAKQVEKLVKRLGTPLQPRR